MYINISMYIFLIAAQFEARAIFYYLFIQYCILSASFVIISTYPQGTACVYPDILKPLRDPRPKSPLLRIVSAQHHLGHPFPSR